MTAYVEYKIQSTLYQSRSVHCATFYLLDNIRICSYESHTQCHQLMTHAFLQQGTIRAFVGASKIIKKYEEYLKYLLCLTILITTLYINETNLFAFVIFSYPLYYCIFELLV